LLDRPGESPERSVASALRKARPQQQAPILRDRLVRAAVPTETLVCGCQEVLAPLLREIGGDRQVVTKHLQRQAARTRSQASALRGDELEHDVVLAEDVESRAVHVRFVRGVGRVVARVTDARQDTDPLGGEQRRIRHGQLAVPARGEP
jgi:hypothetical protein